MLLPPKCPECGARGIHCDSACVVWLCTSCAADGKSFVISNEEAQPYLREHLERLEALEGYVKRHFTPVPR
jgi:ribosomal protein L37AE/L43A